MLKKSEKLIVKKESNGTVCVWWQGGAHTAPPEKTKKILEKMNNEL
jgi:hypothetical protein